MKKPTLLNIFNSLEYANDVSPEMNRLQNLFGEKINELCSDRVTANEIEASVNELLCESQYMGFVQGFDLARSLINGKYI